MGREHFKDPAEYDETVRRLRLAATEILKGILAKTSSHPDIETGVGDEIRAILAERERRAADHRCHAKDCEEHCRPEYLMCARHWAMVPGRMQRRVWDNYRIGQCDDQRPSAEWLAAADAAIAAVAAKEGK